MKKIILGIVALVIVLGGAYLLFGKKIAQAPQTPSQEQAASSSGEQNPVSGIGINTDATVAVGDEPFAALISYTDQGYSPTTVTIKKGETVRFVNTSADQDTWPASAIHPTHSIYPQKSASDCLGSSFDACRGLKPGEFWEFTFNYTGTWRFHDHLHASKTGSIVVN